MSGTNEAERRAYGRAEDTRRLIYTNAVGASVLVSALEHQVADLDASPAERQLAEHLGEVARVLRELRELSAKGSWPLGARDCG